MGNDNVEKIITGEEITPPYSRLEKIMLYKSGVTIEIEEPQSRLEQLMLDWEPGGGGSQKPFDLGKLKSVRMLQTIDSFDPTEVDTSNVTNMNSMFSGCTRLTSLDLSSFDTSNVTNMAGMFNGCITLTSLDLSSFDTSKVTDMNAMFSGCTSLTSLDLSSFDTSNVTDMNLLFNRCSSLLSLKTGIKWNNDITSGKKCTFPAEYMDESGNTYPYGDYIPSGAHTYTKIS